jgi:iron complex transport system permease protein
MRFHRAATAAGAAVVLGVAIIVAVSIGSISVPIGEVWAIIADRVLPGRTTPSWSPSDEHIVWNLRLPRVLLGAVVGASLAMAGAALQALTRNPLADPFLFGVSSGAALAAVASLTGVLGPLAGLSLPAAAFLGALVTTVVVFALAAVHGRLDVLRLVLSGVAVAQVASALTTLLLLRVSGRDGAVTSVLAWLAGSLARATWGGLVAPLVATMVGFVALLAVSSSLNAVALGDDTALAVGVDVGRLRVGVFVITSLLVGVVVARSGAIGFVGLMVPHAARRFVGTDHRRLLPWAAYGGAVLMVIVDLVGRVVIAPNEVPVGVMTALIGGPFFIWILRHRSRTVT